MCELCSSGERIVDAAIEEGRIDLSARDTFVRTYETAPDLVMEVLSATQPDTNRASRNYVASLSDAENAAYKADISQRHGIPLEQVV